MGSNSTRLLVAQVSDGRVQEITRATRITRLAQGVDSTGFLAEEAVARVLAALADYRAEIDRLGAARVTAVATSAGRDADNGSPFLATPCPRLRVDPRVPSGGRGGRVAVP